MDQLEQRMREQFFENCDKHITHAQKKHPVFAYRINSFLTPKIYKDMADQHRQTRDDDKAKKETAIENVLLGEVFEFMEAFSRGDLEAAKEEAADVVAVLFRAIKWASISEISLGAADFNNPILQKTKQ